MKSFKFGLVLLTLLVIFTSFSKLTPGRDKLVVLKHRGYVSYYRIDLKYPVEVEWWDTKARLVCPETKVPRKDEFAPDPLLPKETDLAEYYRGSGFDRGHMCPAADNQCSEILQQECFYFSNMAPQYHSLNAGVWKSLETRTRELAAELDSVKVWCGNVGEVSKIGEVSVPEKCWKVIYIKKTKKWEAYIFENTKNQSKKLDQLAVKVTAVEELTGFKFKP
jgi:endonuclease G